jgi:hypothetical protein
MAVSSLSTLFQETEKLFIEREEQIVAQKVNLQERVRKIFEIGGETVNLTDTEGDDDQLKLNLGGNKLDIKRSVLTKPNFGWNLFSCLFPCRDKAGRIYVDLKEEWLRPLLNRMIYSNDSQQVKGNVFFWYAVQGFNYYKEFRFPTFSVYGGMPIPHGFPGSLPSYLNSGEFAFQLISSTKTKLFYENPREIDLRYKALLFILHNDSYNGYATYLIFSLWDYTDSSEWRMIHGYILNNGWEETDDIQIVTVHADPTPVDPIEFVIGGRLFTFPRRSTASDDGSEIEIYEMKAVAYHVVLPQFDEIVVDTEIDSYYCSQFSNGDRVLNDALMKVTVECYKQSKNYERELNQIESDKYKLEVEIDFMTKRFLRNWGIDSTGGSPETNLEKLVAKRRLIENGNLKRQNKRKRVDEEREGEDEGNIEGKPEFTVVDPIVYFNVEGEVIPILRSTILNSIPESQLAVRVSGRWEEQPGDLDDEGNLKISCHKEAFKHIISSIQIADAGRPLEVLSTL